MNLAAQFTNNQFFLIETRLEIISVRVSEKARSGKFRHRIQTKWFFPIPHRK